MSEVEKAPSETEKKFDLKTHIRDPKSGRVIRHQPYRLLVKQAEGGGTHWLYERPVGSGLYYYSNGEIAQTESEEGLKKQRLAIEMASRTELEKAEADYLASAKRVEAAKAAHHAEEARKKQNHQAHNVKPNSGVK